MSIDFSNIFPKTELFLIDFIKNSDIFSKNRKVGVWLSAVPTERTFFEKQPKIFPVGKFFAELFFKKATLNSWHKLTSTPTSLFLLAQKAQKKKLCKKKTPFLWGVAPSPIRFLKKAKPKTFKLGRQCRQPNSMFVILNFKPQTPIA